MSEWWTYRPEDFLLFSPRVYWRMFELHNAALWPLQVLALAAGLIIILLLAWRPRGYARCLALLLAILWIFVGWSFLWNRYADINWAAAYVAPAFVVEGVLLLVCGPLLDSLAFDRRGLAGCIGYFMLAFALAGQPLLVPLQGRGWAWLASRRIRRRSQRSAFCSSPVAGLCRCSCQSPFSGAS